MVWKAKSTRNFTPYPYGGDSNSFTRLSMSLQISKKAYSYFKNLQNDQNLNLANKSSKNQKQKSSNNYQSITPIPDSQVESKQKANQKNDGLLHGNSFNQAKETSNGLADNQLLQDFDNEDPIPEISFSNQEENGSFVGSENQVQEEEEDDESKYPSDDVEDAELGSLLDDSTDDDDSPQELDSLIPRSSSKPIEVDSKIASDPTFILKKDTGFMSLARSKPSAFVQGVKINVWDDIEPGYGSKSSTEEVVFNVFC
ncbi:hypothetical protein O181_094989 [Austropuccinia psidii MF-1]|uniref:Uncharacterized protein n=1 Tax=Austropuccinia psidii MF-1 TaxID=1389203 RepID=A0A9Q3PBB4_9BASI|nr:hypothetical protein [Austropuccinia psidii MF-1]